MRSRHCQRACKLVNADRPLDGLTVTRRSDVSDARPEGASQSQAVVYDQFSLQTSKLAYHTVPRQGTRHQSATQTSQNRQHNPLTKSAFVQTWQHAWTKC